MPAGARFRFPPAFDQSARAIAALAFVLGVIGCDPSRPARAFVGAPPAGLGGSVVQFTSASGSKLRAWFAKGRPRGGAVLLLHGVGANRKVMLGRARFLHDAGYTVLAPDFQAHGESEGAHITFGARESLDALSAMQFLRTAAPGERVGVIGVSLGGAASLLGPGPVAADALVLESVYPTIQSAVSDRLRVWLGPFGFLGPRLTPQVIGLISRETGVSAWQLQPIDRVSAAKSPILMLTGSRDRYTPLDEARALFQRAPAPKQFWIVDGAGHEDLHAFAPAAYEKLVKEFLDTWLRSPVLASVHSERTAGGDEVRCGHVVLLRSQNPADSGQALEQLRADQSTCE